MHTTEKNILMPNKTSNFQWSDNSQLKFQRNWQPLYMSTTHLSIFSRLYPRIESDHQNGK